jgi:hypothetical protein
VEAVREEVCFGGTDKDVDVCSWGVFGFDGWYSGGFGEIRGESSYWWQ